MKKLLITILLLICPSVVFADQIKIDTTGWDYNSISLVPAGVQRTLSDKQITYDNIEVSLPFIDVINPSAPIDFITSDIIHANIDLIEAEIQTATDEAKAYEEQKRLEYDSNMFKGMTMDDATALIANAQTIEELRSLLTEYVRYEKSKE